ncbi:uncharacterized protein LOC106639577 [Copidosoma floridanum]|uniref:uncharacterized protein LOC106639577 n=1 Tax=Copidosoma floridanum TaxID=29053 RepID=UPI0006C94C60|nr:uncharacterized protein LOC106639577 [Copidosoma floridanum]
MKTTHQHPLILATARRVSRDSLDTPTPEEPVIRLKLDKPPHWEWQLTTSADTLPVIQLLDRDGKLLVETSAGVAQRARGSFHDGLKYHESFPERLEEAFLDPPLFKTSTLGNRNYEGFSSKFGSLGCGFPPRKSRSDATISSSSLSKRHKTRKRHSSNDSKTSLLSAATPMKKNEDAATVAERYSASDYLRQQILDNLDKRNSDTAEPRPVEVACARYKKMKAYLRSQSDGAQSTENEELPRYYKGRAVNGNPILANKKLSKEDLDKIRRFLKEKIQAKMLEEEKILQRIPPDSYSDVPENGITERHSDRAREDERQLALRNYIIRKICSDANIRFEPEVFEASKRKLKARQQQQQKPLKKSFSASDRKKFYRKTKSDVLLSHRTAGGGVDSENDCPASTNHPTQCIRSQDNFERSWRAYRERKRQERLQREQHELAEEDFMKRPRWKDYQRASCSTRNCRICENVKRCVEPMKEDNSKNRSNEDDERPGTSLQENYIVVDFSKNEKMKTTKEKDCTYGVRSPDFGYNSISKRDFKVNDDYVDSCANSNIKKSDTFKVIDGADGEGSDEICYDYKNKTNEEIARDYLKRVYELLRRRQYEAKKPTVACIVEKYEDTSSSNCLQDEKVQNKRRRRRKKIDGSNEGN